MKQNTTILDEFLNLLIDTENYKTPYAKSIGDPEDLILPIIRKSAFQCASLSGFCQLIPGRMGKLSSLIEVYMILRIQSRMIKDIAALYGKEKELTKDIILYCLFKKNNISLLEKSIQMVGTRIVIHSISQNDLQKFLYFWEESLEYKFRGRITNKLFPILGTLTSSAISFFDTRIVGFTANSIFSRELNFQKIPDWEYSD